MFCKDEKEFSVLLESLIFTAAASASRWFSLYADGVDVVFLPKDIVHYAAEVMQFVVTHAYEDYTVVTEQVSREKQSRIHHTHPLRVKTTISFGVRREFSAFGIYLPSVPQVRF